MRRLLSVLLLLAIAAAAGWTLYRWNRGSTQAVDPWRAVPERSAIVVAVPDAFVSWDRFTHAERERGKCRVRTHLHHLALRKGLQCRGVQAQQFAEGLQGSDVRGAGGTHEEAAHGLTAIAHHRSEHRGIAQRAAQGLIVLHARHGPGQ